MINRKELLLSFLAGGVAATTLTGPTRASGGTYPDRPIRCIVPFTAGSVTDITARIIAQRISTTLGQSVVVENVAGASGMIASQSVARAEPDGYTMLMGTNTTHASIRSFFMKVSYDPVTDFKPLAKIGQVALALIVDPKLPVTNVKELIAYAKSNPKKLTFGEGSGSTRMAGEMLNQLAGIDLLRVPYKSPPQAVTDLLAGRISVAFADLAITLPHIQSGTARGLAVSILERSPLAPELPTMAEEGLRGYDIAAWFVAFLPPQTAKPIADKLADAIFEAAKDKQVVDALLKAGIESTPISQDKVAAFIKSEADRWAVMAKSVGIQPE